MKVVLTLAGDQVVIHDPDTAYDKPTLTRWIDEARCALGGDGEVHLLAETEIAADDDGDDEPTDRIGFRGRRGQ